MTTQTRPRRTERPATSDARMLARDLARAEADLKRAASMAEGATRRKYQAVEKLAEIRRVQSERLGVNLPDDPMVLDAAQSIDVEPGDVWRWKGMRNNKGLPTVRLSRSSAHPNGAEVSVVRLLAKALGAVPVDADQRTMLWPAEGYDQDDVNPWHRTIRTSAS